MSDQILEPERFPYCAELFLAQYVLKQSLKEKDDAAALYLSKYLLTDKNIHFRA